MLALFCEYHCPVTDRDRDDGWGVLHHACAGGSVRVVHTLINHKAKVNARNNNKDTPLHIAAEEGECEVALSLISDFGCDPNARGYNEETVLHCACRGGSIDLVHALISKHAADVNGLDNYQSTALHVAAYKGKWKVALSLIKDFGSDPNVPDKNRETSQPVPSRH